MQISSLFTVADKVVERSRVGLPHTCVNGVQNFSSNLPLCHVNLWRELYTLSQLNLFYNRLYFKFKYKNTVKSLSVQTQKWSKRPFSSYCILFMLHSSLSLRMLSVNSNQYRGWLFCIFTLKNGDLKEHTCKTVYYPEQDNPHNLDPGVLTCMSNSVDSTMTGHMRKGFSMRFIVIDHCLNSFSFITFSLPPVIS